MHTILCLLDWQDNLKRDRKRKKKNLIKTIFRIKLIFGFWFEFDIRLI